MSVLVELDAFTYFQINCEKMYIYITLYEGLKYMQCPQRCVCVCVCVFVCVQYSILIF